MRTLNDIIGRLTTFVSRVFKTSLDVFYEALRHSPNAQGYVAGSISELLLKKHLESLGFEVLRIREKWEGQKAHHGDFYIRKRGAEQSQGWFVVEVKGLKSNSEKWHKLYNYDNLLRFLINHSSLIQWIDSNKNVEEQTKRWIERELPDFLGKYQHTLYEPEEVAKYSPNPKKLTKKAQTMQRLRSLTRDEINAQIEERIRYLNSKIRVLETHLVAGTGAANRKIATPRRDEFHVLAVDIFLKYQGHEFLFANPSNLESSSDDEEHLQQNYVIGFVFVIEGQEQIHVSEDWEQDFLNIYETLSEETAVSKDTMQVDNRYLGEEEEDALS